MIKETMAQYAASTAKVWQHDRTKTVGASEIGQCERRTFLAKIGTVPDNDYEDRWGARTRGSVYEDVFWAPAMKLEFGDNLRFAGKDQKTFINGTLSATPDGLVINQKPTVLKHLGVDKLPTGCFTVECKTVDPRADVTEAKPVNIFQTHVQMGLIREQTLYKPTHALLSYTDASFWDTVTEHVIEFDPAVFKIAKSRADKIINGKDISQFKPEGYIARGKECTTCPFVRTCGIERHNLPFQDKPVAPKVAERLTVKAKQLVRLRNAAEKAEDNFRAMQEELKAEMKEAGVNVVPGVVTWSFVKGRETFDNEKIRELAAKKGIKVDNYKKIGEPSSRFKIDLIGDV